MIIGYDFECFKYNWLVVFVNPFSHEIVKIWDNPNDLQKYYAANNGMIFVGYNSRFYDQYLFKGILCGFNAWSINDWIVNKHLPGYQFSKLLNKIKLLNYDVLAADKSLKQLEAFQGHNIYESNVDFKIDRPLTDAEKAEVEHYCLNDVMETLNVFAEKKADFEALTGLIKMFNLPFSSISKTKAQISAQILECQFTDRGDDWDLYTLPCLKLENPKYKNCIAWFFDPINQWYSKNKNKNKNGKIIVQKNPGFTCSIAGVVHNLGFGGIHGALEKYIYICGPDYLLIHVDVESYYPSLMIFWNLLTRNARKPERFKGIYEHRLQLKHEGKKKEQAPLKIVINGTFGISKDKNNAAYDPRNANMICINGQLLLIDLIEKLEAVETFQLIQSNTDGLIIKIHKKDFAAVDDICYEWESRTKMTLEFEYIDKIYQGDVNNYIFHYANVDSNGKKAGKWERKGSYVKELSPLDNDLPIINKALNDYLMHGITPAETIQQCDDYMMFQKIVKLSSKYEFVEHNGIKYDNKCFRVFASKGREGAIYAVKSDGRKDKYANTPDDCYIENGSITGATLPEKLNIDWYIDLANERLKNKFGVEV